MLTFCVPITKTPKLCAKFDVCVKFLTKENKVLHRHTMQHLINNLGKEAEENTRCNRRTDDASHIRTHSVHKQIVGRIVLQTQVIGDTC